MQFPFKNVNFSNYFIAYGLCDMPNDFFMEQQAI